MENANDGKIQFTSQSAWAQVNLFAKARIEMTVMQQSLNISHSKRGRNIDVEQADSHLVLANLSLRSIGPLLWGTDPKVWKQSAQSVRHLFIYLFIYHLHSYKKWLLFPYWSTV